MKKVEDFKACLRSVLSFSKKINSKHSNFYTIFSGGAIENRTYITASVSTSDFDLIPRITRYFYDLTERIPWAHEVEVEAKLRYPSPIFVISLCFRINNDLPEIFYRWKPEKTNRRYRYEKVRTGESIPLKRLCLNRQNQ